MEKILECEEVEMVESMAEAQDKGVEGTELRDSTTEMALRSPTPGIAFSDPTYPPSSDTGVETTDVDNPVMSGGEGECLPASSAVGMNQSHGFTEQWRKRVKESDDEGENRHRPSRKRSKKRGKELDDESDDSEDHALSRSAGASRKLKESLKSGTFVADEGKKERFEKKCRGLDRHAMFRYKESWQVRHSKCSKWVTMREPYNSVRFGEHIKGCKRMGEKGRDGIIHSFFKPRDAKETETMKMAQPSAWKQIVTGAFAKPRETLIPSIPFTSNKRPCLGLRKDQDEHIDTYISRVISKGAGSHSDTHVARMLFGDGVKYSELDDVSKRYVAAAQVHSQKWKISRTLGAVFSTSCKENVTITDKVQSPVCDQCSSLLKLEVFKKALSVQPRSLENLKFTPHRYRNAAINLGINLAKIEGLSNLLEKVS